MKPYEIILPLLVLLLIAAGVRWQFSRTADRTAASGESWAMPVSTPFIPTLCKGKPDCFDIVPDEPVRLAP